MSWAARVDQKWNTQQSYTIRFYRHPEWADRFAQAGIDKPAGMVQSPFRYTQTDAAWLALHLNSSDPDELCEVVPI